MSLTSGTENYCLKNFGLANQRPIAEGYKKSTLHTSVGLYVLLPTRAKGHGHAHPVARRSFRLVVRRER